MSQKSTANKGFSTIITMLWNLKGLTLSVMAALCASSACFILLGFGIREAVNALQSDSSAGAALDRYALMFFGVVCVLGASSFIRVILSGRLSERITAALRLNVFHSLTLVSPRFLERTSIGDIVTRTVTDIAVIQTMISSVLPMAFRNSLLMVIGVIMMGVTAPALSAIMIVLIGLVLVPAIFMVRKLRKQQKDMQHQQGTLGGFIDEQLHGIQTLQSLSLEDAMHQAFTERVETVRNMGMRHAALKGSLAAYIIFCILLVMGLLIWAGGHAVLTGAMSVGALASFAFYTIMVASASGTLSEFMGELTKVGAAMERLHMIIATEEMSQDKHIQYQDMPLFKKGILSIKGLKFAFEKDKGVINDISLQIRPGDKIAIVGASGAGKTTLFKLIMRFYDLPKGTIFVDGFDVTQLRPHEYRKLIGYVPQDPYIYSISIHDNIALGKPNSTRQEVIKAARAAYLEDFIKSLPQGYDTIIGPQGQGLSGGQKQRVALARCILREPQIFLLDEATAALDSESEVAVQRSLDHLRERCAMLVIAHRLSTVVDADKIYVMDKGEIVASGSHKELMHSSPIYRRLVELQFSRIQDEQDFEGGNPLFNGSELSKSIH